MSQTTETVRLTIRQRDVLLLAAYGLTSLETARALKVSVSTVNATRQELKTLLETETLTQAVARALWLRLIAYETTGDPVARIVEARALRRNGRGRFDDDSDEAELVGELRAG